LEGGREKTVAIIVVDGQDIRIAQKLA
jgi:hypothetical protein